MPHDPRLVGDEDKIEAQRSRIPDWIKRLERPPTPCVMPAFGPLGLRGMFDEMLDIAEQMLLRWERFGDSAVIDVADNMTRLTLDTIAL